MRKWLALVVLGAVGLVGCIPQPGVSQRFHVETASTGIIDPPDANGNVHGTGSGTARGTFIGDGTSTGSFLGSGGHTLEPCPSISSAATNLLTLIAENGDTLRLTLSGTSCLLSNRVHVTSSYTINGGTGQFAGATGNGTVIGDFEISTSTSTNTLDGTITFA